MSRMRRISIGKNEVKGRTCFYRSTSGFNVCIVPVEDYDIVRTAWDHMMHVMGMRVPHTVHSWPSETSERVKVRAFSIAGKYFAGNRINRTTTLGFGLILSRDLCNSSCSCPT